MFSPASPKLSSRFPFLEQLCYPHCAFRHLEQCDLVERGLWSQTDTGFENHLCRATGDIGQTASPLAPWSVHLWMELTRSYPVWSLRRWNSWGSHKSLPKANSNTSGLPLHPPRPWKEAEASFHMPFPSLLRHSIHGMLNTWRSLDQYSLNWIIQRPVLRHCPRGELFHAAVGIHILLVNQICPLKSRDIFDREEPGLEGSMHVWATPGSNSVGKILLVTRKLNPPGRLSPRA